MLDQTTVPSATAARDVDLDMRFKSERPGRDLCPDVPFHVITGTVVEGTTWSETYVSGGKTTIVGSGRNLSAVTAPIRSTVVNQTQFWLRRSDGEEWQFTVPEDAVSFRQGHVVSVAFLVDSRQVTVRQIFNHATGVARHLPHPGDKLSVLLFLGGIPANLVAVAMIAMGIQQKAPEYVGLGALLMLGNLAYVRIGRGIARYGRAARAVEAWITANRLH